MKGKLILMLALIMGLITTYFFYQYMNEREVATAVSTEVIDVVSVKESIKINQQIRQEDLVIKTISKQAFHEQMITDIDEVIGKYATADLMVGEAIFTHRIQTTKEEELFVSRKVKEGFRAISLGVNFVQSVSNLIEPEDKVDIIVTTVEKIDGKDEMKSKIVKEGVRVLGIGRRLIESDGPEDYMEYSSVTFELKVEDTVKVIQASEEGNIHLTVHSRLKQKLDLDQTTSSNSN